MIADTTDADLRELWRCHLRDAEQTFGPMPRPKRTLGDVHRRHPLQLARWLYSLEDWFADRARKLGTPAGQTFAALLDMEMDRAVQERLWQALEAVLVELVGQR